MPLSLDAALMLSWSPSGSLAVTPTLPEAPTSTDWLAIGLITGELLTGAALTVTPKVVLAVPPLPSFAVTVMVDDPALAPVTVRVVVPETVALALFDEALIVN